MRIKFDTENKMPDSAPNSPELRGRLILLRGLTREAEHWGGFLDALQQTISQWECQCIDLPGTGRARDIRTPSRVQKTADYVCLELSKLTRRPTVIIGMSFGGMVALDIAAKAPSDICGAVFMNTSAREVAHPFQRVRPIGALGIVASLLVPSVPLREKWIHTLTSINSSRSDRERRRWIAIQKSRPVHRRTAFAQLLAAARFHPPKKITLPTLWLAGAKDQLVDVACTRGLWHRFGGTLKVYPYAGHDLSLDAPAWCARRIRDFLETLDIRQTDEWDKTESRLHQDDVVKP